MKKIIFLILLILPICLSAQNINHVFVILNSKPDKEKISEQEQERLQKEHIKNIERLVEEGKMIVAGPFEEGGGIFIFKSSSSAETREWLQTDPAIRANRWDVDIFPIQFLKGGACLAQEPYEMVTYYYTRINNINDIANYKINKADDQFWEEMVDFKEVIMTGVFSNNEGGIAISLEKINILSKDSYSDQKEFLPRVLWVARGSFCEYN